MYFTRVIFAAKSQHALSGLVAWVLVYQAIPDKFPMLCHHSFTLNLARPNLLLSTSGSQTLLDCYPDASQIMSLEPTKTFSSFIGSDDVPFPLNDPQVFPTAPRAVLPILRTTFVSLAN